MALFLSVCCCDGCGCWRIYAGIGKDVIRKPANPRMDLPVYYAMSLQNAATLSDMRVISCFRGGACERFRRCATFRSREEP